MENPAHVQPRNDMIPSDECITRFAPLRPVEGCDRIIAHQADDLFALWEAWESEAGAQCATPFWAIAWPAAVVLARHILMHRHCVAGKTVLDLGCGGGVAGIVAARAGARRVIANDIDPVALEIARRNAAANRVSIETCPCNLVEEHDYRGAEVIFVADLFYHRTASAALIAYLRQARKNSISVLIADGNRPFAPATGISVVMQETVPVSMELEGVPLREVRLLALADD
jgi:predicted nicotinamide N-methyase